MTCLIVTGVSDDTTTAVANLLNNHPNVCLGTERYKFQYVLHRNFSPELFEKERFFDFRRTDTDLRPDCSRHWAMHYETLAARRADCTLIGDSQAGLSPCLGDMILALPEARFVYVLQNLKDMALTAFDRAADRDADPQAAFHDACETWAAHCAALHELMRNPALRKSVLLLDYDHMFGPEQDAPGYLLTYLGLPADPAFDQFFRGQQTSIAAQSNSQRLPGNLVDIYKAVSQDDIRALRKLARDNAMA